MGFVLVPASARLTGGKGGYFCAIVCSTLAIVSLGALQVASHGEPCVSLGGGSWFATQGQGVTWDIELGARNLPVVTAVVTVSWVVILFSG